MPNDLSIKAVAAVTGASENPAEPQAASSPPPAHAPPAQTASPIPNPELRLDAALGLVVIEFHDGSGTVTTSIPSQRQLAAYRIWDQKQPGLAGGIGPPVQPGAPQVQQPPASAGAQATGPPLPKAGSGAGAPATPPVPPDPQAAVHVSATDES